MADRVHPNESSPEEPLSPTHKADQPQSETCPALPPPGTYVVKVPKDQVLRVPPPQNAKLFERYTRRSTRRGHRCCCLTLLILAVLVFLAGAAAGIFYLVVKPESPAYTITSLSITGLNLTASSPSSAVSPEIITAIQVKNPNDKLGVYHVGGSSIRAYYMNVNLANGVLPVLSLPSNSEVPFNVTLRGEGIVLGSEVSEALINGQSQGRVPLRLKVRAPVKFKVGAVKTWKITVKLTCDVTVDKLTAGAKIVREKCDYGVNIL
ncbi:NDR1/HIN1-like protein 13 [Punica granatum]|uniref:NDR1/HIN1-like protein 13 n=2 Tax=Punica granatum TaxID=22663 RepID=A0A6P8DTP3_PUNGR|nr:NDR1/HIN1-like protein 13 [Punica granatum]XP_031400817.1 NDR1/HIN1-like protein 13 [Punica granatum]OWM69084.1 hypothetical protein CDL15_Pgr025271 [Punica granatum]PKI73291.1 hypothetical protein CRG98_006229 [Punica granatum]